MAVKFLVILTILALVHADQGGDIMSTIQKYVGGSQSESSDGSEDKSGGKIMEIWKFQEIIKKGMPQGLSMMGNNGADNSGSDKGDSNSPTNLFEITKIKEVFQKGIPSQMTGYLSKFGGGNSDNGNAPAKE